MNKNTGRLEMVRLNINIWNERIDKNIKVEKLQQFCGFHL